MPIRTFQKGDEAAQVAIYNQAAAALPRFKPATGPEIQRRTTARDFDPTTRFYAEEGGQLVGYCLFQTNGRVSYPWCRPGYQHWAEPLFEKVVRAMRDRHYPLAFAAYRSDWRPICDFFVGHGFRLAREMVNFLQQVVDMPTASYRAGNPVTPLRREDIPGILQLAPEALRVQTPEALEENLFRNPYFGPEALFVLRAKTGGEPLAVGVLITESTYADPKGLDPLMPCFRLGAFGTERMQTKRIKGLFSVLARQDTNFPALALDALSRAVLLIQESDDLDTLAAQVPSDVPHLVHFYAQNFQRQGSFPVYERSLLPAPAV
jgi:hypothetical protein